MRNILVVDDDREITQLIALYLKNEGYTVQQAHDGLSALQLLSQSTYDLMVLDIMMPEMDGIEVCRRVREHATLPILMVSAKAEDMDKILGLMTGADDYMIKPFNPLELVARVKSLLRRSLQYSAEAQPVTEDVIRIHQLEINRSTHQVSFESKSIVLTSREFDILYLLASHPGRVYGAEEIFQFVWQEKYFASNNTVMVHICNLRDKLEKAMGYKMIQTVWGVGYKIDA